MCSLQYLKWIIIWLTSLMPDHRGRGVQRALTKTISRNAGCTSHWSTYFVARSNYAALLICAAETQSNRQRSHLSDKGSMQGTEAAAFLKNTHSIFVCVMVQHTCITSFGIKIVSAGNTYWWEGITPLPSFLCLRDCKSTPWDHAASLRSLTFTSTGTSGVRIHYYEAEHTVASVDLPFIPHSS